MSGMREIARLMKGLEDQLAGCMRCGTCQAVCPLFAETAREADVARGKLALLDGLRQEMFKDPAGVYKRLNRCLLCGSCALNCPSGVSVLEIFIKARAILTGCMDLSMLKKIILRRILSFPETFARLAAWGVRLQKLFTRPANQLLGTSCARLVAPLPKNRHFKPLAPVPFHQMVPSLNTAPKGSGARAAFFVGCLIDNIFPNVAKATVKVLNHHGIEVFMPRGQGCCGLPAMAAGDAVAFDRLVRYNLEKFDGNDIDYLVSACSTCAFTIKKIWPMMFQDDSEEVMAKIERMAGKTFDINQFLVSEVGIKSDLLVSNDDAVVVTYHDPCHLKKSMKVSAEPRALITANPAYCLKEMPESDWCCGSGGNFNLEYYELSARIGKRKCDNITSSGCSVVATACPACMIQISDMLSQSGEAIIVKHPVEIYAELLKN
ncbi:MAG: (Fe-S)-binding protein [Deltaproteobacteria bacterium CG1_02_45_11]|nr:MAG: (Fe-S)-binding protein [Deltaproteobacteria bacterium CG1_02_45_11]